MKDSSSTNVFTKDPKIINGLTDFKLEIRNNFPVSESFMVHISEVDSESCEVNFTNLTPGSVIAFRLVGVAPVTQFV